MIAIKQLKSFLIPKKANFSKNNIQRLMSTNQLVSTALPSNLHLADTSILEPLPEPVIAPELYAFPTLNVPSEMIVKKLLSPGETAQPVKLERTIFEVAIRKDIVLNVVRHLRNQRRQPHKTKTISEISGSKRKPIPQKKTGRSQVGHKRNSSWRGGYKAHGPVIRDFSISLNRKYRALGMMITLTAKFRENNLVIFDNLKTESLKTKELLNILKDHDLADSRVLFVDEGLDKNFEIACRNLPKVSTLEQRHMNVYDILKRDKLVFSRSTFESVQERLLAQYHYNGRRKRFERDFERFAEAEKLIAEQEKLEN